MQGSIDDWAVRALDVAQIPGALDMSKGAPEGLNGQEAVSGQVVATIALVRAVEELTEAVRAIHEALANR